MGRKTVSTGRSRSLQPMPGRSSFLEQRTSPVPVPPGWKAADWRVGAAAATAGGLAALAGLALGGGPWAVLGGLGLGGLVGGSAGLALVAWRSRPANSPSASRMDDSRDFSSPAALPLFPARAAADVPLFDATRPIPPVDPNLLALSSADRLASKIQEDTQRFRHGHPPA